MKPEHQIDFTGPKIATAVQNALDSLMMEMRPTNNQQIGDILCCVILRMTEMLAVVGNREQSVVMLEKMIPYIRACELPKLDFQSVDLGSVHAGNKTVN